MTTKQDVMVTCITGTVWGYTVVSMATAGDFLSNKLQDLCSGKLLNGRIRHERIYEIP